PLDTHYSENKGVLSAVDTHKSFLMYPAYRSEGMSTKNYRSKTNSEEFGDLMLSQCELIDSGFGQRGKVGVGIGAGLPLRVKKRVGLGAVRFATERVRKSSAVVGRGNCADGRLRVEIR